jgi:glycosyltransferase involved in cell wall biosynthesis
LPKPKRILIAIDHASTGGCQEVIKTWLVYLCKHNLDLFVVVLHGKGEYIKLYQELGIKTISLSNYKYNPIIILKFFFIIKNFKPDVIHNNLVISSILGSLFGKFLSINKIIVHVQTEMPLRGAYRYLKSIYKRSVKSSHLIIAVSDKVKFNLIKYYEFPENKITILANTYNINIKQKQPEFIKRLREQFGLPKNALIFGTSGTLIYYKNHELAINAINEIVKSQKNIYLFIAGEGPDREMLEELVKKHDLADHVFLLGKLPHSDTDFPNYNTFIHMLDAFILSSKIEGFPLVALEAMYAKKFVIAAKVSGIETNFIHEKEILSFDIDNQKQLVSCLNQRIKMNEDEVLQITKAAHEKVSNNFGPEHIVECLLKFYTND